MSCSRTQCSSTLVRPEPGTPRSQVKYSITEPQGSSYCTGMLKLGCGGGGGGLIRP